MEVEILVLPVTFTFIAICAGALMPLTGWVGIFRGSIDVLRGDGGNPVLFKRHRIHGNFIENAPLIALVLGSAEMMGLEAFWLWLAVASFIVGRVLHYFMYDKKARAFPMTLTQAPGLVLGLWVVWTLWMA